MKRLVLVQFVFLGICVLPMYAGNIQISPDEIKEKDIKVDRLLSKLSQGKQVTIVALGDSNTELTFHTRGHLNWVGLLQESLYEKYGPNKVMMINSGCSGENATRGLKRLDRDVLRFSPDLVIICYWDGNMEDLKSIITKLRSGGVPEILLRTPNPVIATNQPAVSPPVTAGKEWPGSNLKKISQDIVTLAKELEVPVVDHYTHWMQADASHDGSPTTNPNKLWLRMSDSMHPGPIGHVAFYRELAPFFGLPDKLSWEF